MRRRGAPQAAWSGADWRVLGFFVLAFCLWLATSANGRYGLLVLLLAGLCLARLLEHLLPLRPARIAMAVLLVTQIAACSMITAPRWFIAERWSWRWLPFDVAEQGVREPALYLTVETLPMAVVAPSLHPDASLVNLRGQYSIAPGNPRLQALFERHPERVRVMGRYLQLRADGRPRDAVVVAYDSSLIRFGFRIDAGRCFAITWQPDDTDVLSRIANQLTSQPKEHAAALSMGSCALVAATRDPAHIEEERRVSAAFDRVEKLCPGLLRGHSASTEALGPEWMRNYPGLDARLETNKGRLIFDRYLKLRYYDLGPVSGWEQAEPPPRPQRAVATGEARRHRAVELHPVEGELRPLEHRRRVVLYDDMQFTRRDWRNRNLIKTPRGAQWLTIPVAVKGRYLQKICETRISEPGWGRAIGPPWCTTTRRRLSSSCIVRCSSPCTTRRRNCSATST